MQENFNNGEGAFSEIVRPIFESFLISGVELTLTITAFILFIIATVQLYRKTRIAGTKHILIALAALILGIVSNSIYLFFFSDEGNQTVNDLFGVYMSACTAFGTYGYWLLSKAVIKSNHD